MTRVLVAYGTRHGKAAQLAQRIVDRMREAGLDARAINVREKRDRRRSTMRRSSSAHQYMRPVSSAR
jgi:menaquinone-dependent protoporphyrinogen IX oxidase